MNEHYTTKEERLIAEIAARYDRRAGVGFDTERREREAREFAVWVISLVRRATT